MASLTTTLGVEFTPAVGYFIVRVSGGNAVLLGKNSSGDARFEPVAGPGNPITGRTDVYNAVDGARYKLESASPGQNVTIAVDQ